MDKKILMKILRYGLILLICATLIFIFAQSMKSPEESAADSDKVGDIIAEVIPPETKPGEFIQTNIRKLAHFTEFFVLGAEIAAYALIFYKNVWVRLLHYPLGILFALLDETVQIFTERGPQIVDVWIDFLGYTVSAATVTAVFFLVKFISDRFFKQHNQQGI